MNMTKYDFSDDPVCFEIIREMIKASRKGESHIVTPNVTPKSFLPSTTMPHLYDCIRYLEKTGYIERWDPTVDFEGYELRPPLKLWHRYD